MLLLGIIIISFLAKNKPMIWGGLVVLILSIVDNQNIIKYLKNNLLDMGLLLLIIWMLLPLIDNANKLTTLNTKNALNINMLVSFLCGLFMVTIAGKGLNYLEGNTTVIYGIIFGSTIGVTFLGGVPVGMLTASGITYLIMKLLDK